MNHIVDLTKSRITIGEQFQTESGAPRFKAVLTLSNGVEYPLVFAPRVKGANEGSYIASIPSACVKEYSTSINKTLPHTKLMQGGTVEVDLTPGEKSTTRKRATGHPIPALAVVIDLDNGAPVIRATRNGVEHVIPLSAADAALVEAAIKVRNATRYYLENIEKVIPTGREEKIAQLENLKAFIPAKAYADALAKIDAEYSVPSIEDAADAYEMMQILKADEDQEKDEE